MDQKDPSHQMDQNDPSHQKDPTDQSPQKYQNDQWLPSQKGRRRPFAQKDQLPLTDQMDQSLQYHPHRRVAQRDQSHRLRPCL